MSNDDHSLRDVSESLNEDTTSTVVTPGTTTASKGLRNGCGGVG